MMATAPRLAPTPSRFADAFDWAIAHYLSDIVPIVSADAGVRLSPGSGVQELGKVPTEINRAGLARGLKGWCGRQTTLIEADAWKQDARLGLGLQTRLPRGFDLDLTNVGRIAEAVAIIKDVAGKLPVRGRDNSKKKLLAFECDDPSLTKHTFRTDDGELIELLADKQQMVIAGVHPSGAPYEWEGGLPEGRLPSLTRAQVDEIAARIEALPWVVNMTIAGVSAERGERIDSEAEDEETAWVIEHADVIRVTPEGEVQVVCPQVELHSGNSGPSESVWFPPNSKHPGHYVCKHSHCEGYNRNQFLAAIGYGGDDFKDETLVGADGEVALLGGAVARPPFTQVDVKTGAVPATRDNLEKALTNERWLRARVAFDEFAGDIVISWGDAGEWRPINDNDFERLMLDLERRGFKEIAAPKFKGMVALVADQQRFDSAISWLNGLRWDGVERVERFLVDFFETEDTPYTRAVSLYWWTAHAARVLDPGAQCDMVPVLVSPEGRFKSTSLQVLAPSFDHFAEIDLGLGNADLSRHIKGKLIGELGELQGLRKRERAELKAFVTRRVEEYVPKYIDRPRRYPRRLVFVGTTNEAKFLSAETGERRWLPVTVECGRPERLAAARDQLWAEARVLFERDGVAYQGAERLAPAQRDDFREVDSWGDAVLAWRDAEEGFGSDWFTTDQALHGIGLPISQHFPRNQQRMSEVLRALGYVEGTRKKIEGKKRRVWTTETTGEARV